MDFNGPQSYKPSTLFKNESSRICGKPRVEMDKDFLQLIENVDELIPQTRELLDDDCLICECFCVSAGDIRQVCMTSVELELLKETFNLGTGCQSCLKNLNSWKDKIF